jgi:glycosyltransferase involved in cell wall biosynthesis
MRILQCYWSLDPALGGISEAVRQACLGLPELGHTAEVVCLDKPDAPWLRHYPAQVYALGPPKLVVRGASLQPYGYSRRFIRWMRANAANYDAIIVEGLWQFTGLGTWLALRRSTTPYFVWIHSMLDPWFNDEYPIKRIKKRVYWLLVEYKVLRDARAVLYYSESERAVARQSFRPYRVKEEAFAGLAISVPSGDTHHQQQLFLSRYPELRNRRLVLFLGRIHPKKGCDLLIEAFARVSHIDPSLHLVLAGPDPVDWRQELQKRVKELGLESKVTWTGMLSGDNKWGALHCAEVFVLPSHTEGFPVAVIEALACSVPVLITDKVHIWPEVKATGGGFIARDDLGGVTELLETWLELTDGQRESMRLKAYEGYNERFARSAVLEKLVYVLRTLGVSDHSSNGQKL